MDILIKNREMTKGCDGCPCQNYNPIMEVPFCNLTYTTLTDELAEQKPSWCPLILVPEHNDLADKSVIIERMGDAHDELWDKVDEKALSECHVAFLKAVMYAPTVIPSTVKIPTDGIEPKEVWDKTWTTEAKVEGERTT